MARVNLYDILGVPPEASFAEIKQAYRRLAMQHHPDHNPGDRRAEERFKQLAAAYEVLSDPTSRRVFDAERRHHSGRGRAHSPFTDWVDDFFSNQRHPRRPQPRQGRDVAYEIEVELLDLLHGLKTSIDVLLEHPDMAHDLHANRTRDLLVHVPAGARDGQRLRHPGLGEPGYAGGAAGDLYLIIRQIPHPFFKRRDDIHLLCTVPINFAQATLGAEVEVPTLEGGTLFIRVPPGTQSGKTLRVRGRGMPALDSHHRGDLLLELVVETPSSLSPDQARMLQAFTAQLTADAEPARQRYLAKLDEHLGRDPDDPETR